MVTILTINSSKNNGEDGVSTTDGLDGAGYSGVGTSGAIPKMAPHHGSSRNHLNGFNFSTNPKPPDQSRGEGSTVKSVSFTVYDDGLRIKVLTDAFVCQEAAIAIEKVKDFEKDPTVVSVSEKGQNEAKFKDGLSDQVIELRIKSCDKDHEFIVYCDNCDKQIKVSGVSKSSSKKRRVTEDMCNMRYPEVKRKKETDNNCSVTVKENEDCEIRKEDESNVKMDNVQENELKKARPRLSGHIAKTEISSEMLEKESEDFLGEEDTGYCEGIENESNRDLTNDSESRYKEEPKTECTTPMLEANKSLELSHNEKASLDQSMVQENSRVGSDMTSVFKNKEKKNEPVKGNVIEYGNEENELSDKRIDDTVKDRIQLLGEKNPKEPSASTVSNNLWTTTKILEDKKSKGIEPEDYSLPKELVVESSQNDGLPNRAKMETAPLLEQTKSRFTMEPEPVVAELPSDIFELEPEDVMVLLEDPMLNVELEAEGNATEPEAEVRSVEPEMQNEENAPTRRPEFPGFHLDDQNIIYQSK